ARLSAPPEFRADHDRIVALQEKRERVANDRSLAPADSARAAVAGIVAVDEIAGRLATLASTDEQRGYATKLGALVAQDAAEYETATRAAERATAEAVRKLTRMRAPSAAREEHAAVVEAFSAYATS